ncbi:MAG: N-acetylmuramoyl-L-alanine amidase [Muribaculaceae bacterium]|nr:N-acetylmuramoyl-L-alanine amidase [Muribaculaceae bacterium]
MKKILLLTVAAIMAAGMLQAQTPDQVRIYLNPGHGSWGPNDRPMATIPYPNLPETGRPDTCGFYETNTNLWKILRMGEVLERMGVKHENIMYSRVKNGPFPYVSGAPDEELYNRPLSEIAREVDANNMDIFVSIHSNAATDGTSTNYPLFLYRGQDKPASGDYEHNEGSYEMCDACWLPHYMDELDPQSHYSRTQKNIRGDWNFYGSTYQTTTSKGTFTGYLGVLRHGTPGFLMEGYFHTYQPARHRALNPDYCYQEGTRTARGLCDYFNLNPEPTGYIMGTIKDKHIRINNPLFTYANGSDDQWMPLNGATVRLLKDGQVVDTYQVDNNYNGIFVFEDLEPGLYTLDASCEGYEDLDAQYKGEIEVKANETAYTKIYLSTVGYLQPETFFKNYPDPVQPEGLTMPESFEFTQQAATLSGIEGTVKRAIVRGDSTFVLENNGLEANIHVVNNKTQQVVGQVSTAGLHSDTGNLGFYSPLSDIAFTADGTLVGVNSIRNQSQDRFVDDGYKRGTLYIYKWLSLADNPVDWITTDNSASCYRGDMGTTMAVAGSASNCTILVSAINASNGNVRLLTQKFYDGAVTSIYYTERSSSATHPFSTSLAGNDFRLTLSPRDETHLGENGLIVNANQFVWDGGLITPHEINLAASTANSTELASMSSDLVNPASGGVSFFRYLDRAMMVVPVVADGMVTGVNVLDVTDGLDQATQVNTLGTTLAEPISAEGATLNTGAKVDGEKVDLILMVDNKMIRFTQDTSETVTGDLTGDGIVDVSDVNLLINVILGNKTVADCAGDPNLNGDASVDVSDVNAIINIILRK